MQPESKPHCANTFQVSTCKFTDVLLAKASHLARTRFKGWRNRLHPLVRQKELVAAFQIYHCLLPGHKLFTFLLHAKCANLHPRLPVSSHLQHQAGSLWTHDFITSGCDWGSSDVVLWVRLLLIQRSVNLKRQVTCSLHTQHTMVRQVNCIDTSLQKMEEQEVHRNH